ncbi:unnamed protein product [Allacma fusca]|uniref:Uncharacterized protein n=1 Tax=Allacma fusca TaxID=39272 RepID=A0A8J2K304_9HEXA|nr:unnamed protein product [Allacma fusca]
MSYVLVFQNPGDHDMMTDSETEWSAGEWSDESVSMLTNCDMVRFLESPELDFSEMVERRKDQYPRETC